MKQPFPDKTSGRGTYYLWEPEPSIEGEKVHEWHLPIEVFERLKGGRPYYGNTRAYPNWFDAIADYVDAVRATQ